MNVITRTPCLANINKTPDYNIVSQCQGYVATYKLSGDVDVSVQRYMPIIFIAKDTWATIHANYIAFY